MKSPTFSIVPGMAIAKLLAVSHSDIVAIVREAYLLHHAERTVNPDSYFLRFPDRPDARIIALPAALRGEQKLSGIKWISSYPANTTRNLQRASAVLMLNDYETGYPFACLEGAQISAARTAASAVLAAQVLTQGARVGSKLAVVGAGTVARTVLDYFRMMGWTFDKFSVFDLNGDDAGKLAGYAAESMGVPAAATRTLEEAVRSASIVLFATTAATPHVDDASLFDKEQVILHLSLRDLAPAVILSATNIVDDVGHCLKANTSLHLTAQQVGNSGFIAGTLAQVLTDEFAVDRSKPVIFSPFGLGILDLAVGRYLFESARAIGVIHVIDGFFPSTQRW